MIIQLINGLCAISWALIGAGCFYAAPSWRDPLFTNGILALILFRLFVDAANDYSR